MFTIDIAFFSSIRTIIQRMHSLSDKKLALFGLNRSEMTVLLKIYEKKGKRQKDIIQEAGSEGISTGIAVKTLSAKGYIVKKLTLRITGYDSSL